ncbi:MAG: hypothetical protein KatS3mg089_1021 [Patescibacteria group bacterium]|nr:MAG: hypothetical protein KatS3mg089_1021 [Patescibacteria group bacterium]
MISARKLLITAATFSLYLTTASPILAQSQNVTLCPENIFGSGNCTKLANATFNGIIGTIFTYLLIAGALVAIIFLIWGGIKWITSRGDKTKVESARYTIIGAIIGLIIVFASFLIINLVTNTLFKVSDVTQLEPPSLTN